MRTVLVTIELVPSRSPKGGVARCRVPVSVDLTGRQDERVLRELKLLAIEGFTDAIRADPKCPHGVEVMGSLDLDRWRLEAREHPDDARYGTPTFYLMDRA